MAPYVPKACGFVLVREGPTGWQYLVLVSRKHGEAGLPKGHVEPGEDELATAWRETREETGLAHVDANPHFRTTIRYPVTRRGRTYEKEVVYFVGVTDQETVHLSDEHTSYDWLALPDALSALPHANLRAAVREAALFLKDAGLFALEPATEAQAEAHLRALPHTTEGILGHVRGGARIARGVAEALAAAGKRVDVKATAIGALLHDVGRCLGHHEDHPLAGLKHLRATDLAPYGFACLSHFAKGAFAMELVQAGLDPEEVAEHARWIDLSTLTWEEQCVALADACMMHDQVVAPTERFADLRRRYADSHALIALQERRTRGIRRMLTASLGRDPLRTLGIADDEVV